MDHASPNVRSPVATVTTAPALERLSASTELVVVAILRRVLVLLSPIEILPLAPFAVLPCTVAFFVTSVGVKLRLVIFFSPAFVACETIFSSATSNILPPPKVASFGTVVAVILWPLRGVRACLSLCVPLGAVDNSRLE